MIPSRGRAAETPPPVRSSVAPPARRAARRAISRALLLLAVPLSDPAQTRTAGQWDSKPLDPNVPLRRTKAAELADQRTGHRERDNPLRSAQGARSRV